VKPPGDLAVGPLAESERPAAISLLAASFCDQPLDRAVVGGRRARRLRAGRAGMAASLEAAAGRADLRAARLDATLAAVLVAVPPHGYPLPPPSARTQLRTLWRQGFRVARRWRTVFDALQERRPEAPCWTLSLLGVSPPLQGRGIGTTLLRSWLQEVDAVGERVWLETARPTNVPFYQRQGFRVHDEIEVLGVPVWLMDRPARPTELG
jgi:GNAT superfamily N-acetyltransferase